MGGTGLEDRRADDVDVMDDGYRAYAAGKTNVSFRTFSQRFFSATDRALRSDQRMAAGRLRASKAVMLAMWEAGVREREVKPGAVRIGAGDVTQKQVDEMFVVGEVFKDYGRGVVFVDELYSSKKAEFADLAGALREGRVLVPLSAYNAYTGKTENNRLLLSADHETVHQIKVENRTLYDGLRDMAIRKLKQQLGEEGYQQIYDQRYEAYRAELTEEDAKAAIEEEITAQYFGAMHERSFCETEVQKDPGFWAKVKELFQKLVDQIRRKLEQLAKKDLVVKAAMEADLYDVQAAVNLLEGAMKVAKEQADAGTTEAAEGEIKKAAEEAEKMSKVVYDFSKSFEKQIDDFKAGKFPKNDSIIVCGTPKIFQKIGLHALPMLYGQGHLREALINADGDHLGEVNLKKVPKALETPLAIIDNANHPGRLVAIIEIPAHNRNVIAAVEIDGTGRMHEKSIDGNVITTIHSRNNAISKLLKDAVLSESQGKGGIYFWDKNKALVSARSHGGQFPGVSTVPDGFIRSISDPKSNVNKKLQSELQSKQFRRWFMGSKVVNPDGSPRIVYHQTAAQFTVFNTNNPVAGKNDSETPNGIFFKDNDHDIGIGGDKQMAVYLSIKKPLHFANREAANKWYRENIEGYADLADEQKKALEPISKKMDEIEDQMFAEDLTTEEYEALDQEWNTLLEKMKQTEDSYSSKLRDLLNSYFLGNDSGYDGIILDYDGHRYVNGKREDVHTYIVFKNTQIKSATDNIGTFDGTNPDIRYSRVLGAEEAEYVDRLRKENRTYNSIYDELQDVNDAVHEIAPKLLILEKEEDLKNEKLREIARTYSFSSHDRKYISHMTERLKKAYSLLVYEKNLQTSLYGAYKLMREELLKVGEIEKLDDGTDVWISKGEEKGWYGESLDERATDYAVSLVSDMLKLGGYLNTEQRKKLNAVKEMVRLEQENRRKGIKSIITRTDEQMMREIEKLSGKEQDTIALEMQRQEIENSYRFKAIRQMHEERLQKTKQAFQEQIQKQALYNQMQRDAQFARNKEFNNRQRAYHEEQLRALREDYEKRLDRLKDTYSEQISGMKKYNLEKEEKYDAEVAALGLWYQDELKRLEEKREETRKKGVLRREMHRNLMRLGKLATQPTDSAHLPEELKRPIMEFLFAFSGDGNMFTTKMITELAEAYAGLQRKGDDGKVSEEFAGYEEKIHEMILTLQNKFAKTEGKKRTLTSLLSLEELQELSQIVTNLRYIINNANDIFLKGRRAKVSELSDRASRQLTDKKQSNLRRGMRDSFFEKQLNNNMLTPIFFFNEHLGGVFSELYEEFRDGQDLAAQRARIGEEHLEKLKKQYKYDDWKKQSFDFAVVTPEGTRKITIDIDGLMQVYATDKRERIKKKLAADAAAAVVETQEQRTRSHILDGGVIIGPEMQQRNEKVRERVKRWKRQGLKGVYREVINGKIERTNAEAVSVSQETLDAMLAVLKPEQKAYADALVEFLSKETSKWGNEASMRLSGIKKFNEDYYFPFETVSHYRYTKFGVTDDRRLKNLGFTKQTVKNAANPLLINGLTQVAARHINQMAQYSAMAVPIENFTRVYNYSEAGSKSNVKTALMNALGTGATDYIENFMTAINGGVKSDEVDKIGNRLASVFKKSAVMANASVVIQQPTAIGRAAAMIHPKYFLGKVTKEDVRLMYEWCPVALVKSIGGFDTGTGYSFSDYILGERTKKDKLNDVLGWGAEKADEVTWANIFNAVRRETNKEHKELEYGSKEYIEHVNKRFRDIIDYTQVYDSVLSKNLYMRSQSAFAKMVTAFSAEPLLSYNLLTQSGLHKNGRTINKGRAIFAFTLNTVINAIAQSIVGAWRHKDEDETYLEAFFSAFFGNLIGNKENLFLDGAWSIFGMIPWIKDIISIWQDYDVERIDVTAVSDLINAGQALMERGISERDFSERKDWNDVLNFAGAISGILGIPIGKVVLDLKSIYFTVSDWMRHEARYSGITFKTAILEGMGFKISDEKEAYESILYPEKYEEIVRRLLTPDVEKYKDYDDPQAQAEKAANQRYHNLIRQGLRDYDARLIRAVDAIENGDYETYSKLRQEIIDAGFEVNDVQAAIDTERRTRKEKTYTETSAAEKDAFVKQDLADAVMRGDKDGIRFLIDWFADHQEDTTEADVQKYVDQGYSQQDAEAKARDAARSSTHNLIKGVLVEYDDRILKAATAKWTGDFETYEGLLEDVRKDGFPSVDVQSAVNSLVDGMRPKTYEEKGDAEKSPYDKKDLADAIERGNGKDFLYVKEKLLGLGVEEGDISDYVVDYAKGAYLDGLDADSAMEIMETYADLDEKTAETKIAFWNYSNTDEERPMNYQAFVTYYTKVEGIDVDVYEQYWLATKDLKADKDANGKSIKYSLMEKIVRAIDSMSISPSQKTALFRIKYPTADVPNWK